MHVVPDLCQDVPVCLAVFHLCDPVKKASSARRHRNPTPTALTDEQLGSEGGKRDLVGWIQLPTMPRSFVLLFPGLEVASVTGGLPTGSQITILRLNSNYILLGLLA